MTVYIMTYHSSSNYPVFILFLLLCVPYWHDFLVISLMLTAIDGKCQHDNDCLDLRSCRDRCTAAMHTAV